MAGKSTYMRQVAQIVILAQMGSFVPASHAELGIIDSVFTRVGASDDLSAGQSTFMVEMNEVAYILDNATPNMIDYFVMYRNNNKIFRLVKEIFPKKSRGMRWKTGILFVL